MIEIRGIDILSIDDYVDIVRNVWALNHHRRKVTDYAMHVLDHASKLGEAIRLEDLDEIFCHLAEVSNWLFGFVAKLNDEKINYEKIFNIPTKLSDMVWYKYPNLCPVCFKRNLISLLSSKKIESINEKDVTNIGTEIEGKCLCLKYYPETEHRSYEDKKILKDNLLTYAMGKISSKPTTLGQTESMFHKIYSSNTAIQTLESIGFHLLEEVGEMARAIMDLYTERNEDKTCEEKVMDLCDEIADTFSWICTLTAKLHELFKSRDSLHDKISDKLNSIFAGFGASFEERTLSYKIAKNIRLEMAILLRYLDTGSMKYKCPYCNKIVCECELKFAWEKSN